MSQKSKKKKNFISLLPSCFAIALLLSSSTTEASPSGKFLLSEYISQVEENNPALRASQKSEESFSLRYDQGTVITAPYIFAGYSILDDKKETQTPSFQGDRTKGHQFSAGLGIDTSVGLSAKYSFNVNKTEIQNASPTTLPIPNFYTAYNQLELNQSLIRNGFGSEIGAQKTALNSSNLAQAYAEKFNVLRQRTEAENAYWRLVFARKGVEIQKDVLARAEKLLAWAKKRVNLQLGDKADLLQAQASVDLRKLELVSSMEEEKNAARTFNLLRAVPGEQVLEVLNAPTIKETITLSNPKREGIRLDIVAAEHQEKALIASAQLEKEKAKPNLDLFATIAWNGRDGARAEAMEESLRSSHSTLAVGIKFSAPLAVPTMYRTWKGTDLAKESASLQLEKSRLDEEQSWKELSTKLKDAKSRLALLQGIEQVQKEKYEHERQRLMRGRTTTYQALNFEQDYAQAQLLSIRTQAEVLQLTAQIKLFRGEE